MHGDVLIITLNFNQNEYTIKCIESLLKSEYKSYTIMLIDNGSTEANYKDLKTTLPQNMKLHLHRIEENRGYVGGINFGLEKGALLKPNFFLIMNNDTVIDEYAISELVEACVRYNNQAIVTGKVYHYDSPNIIQDIGYTFKSKKKLTFNHLGMGEEDYGQYDEEKERDMLDDVFWLLPRSLYNTIGGYSSYFWFNAEQADFALRAKKSGYKLIYSPNAKLWHKGSVSIGGRERNPKLAYWHIQSTLIFRYLHLSRKEFLIRYFQIIISILRAFTRAIFKKNEDRSTGMKYAMAKLLGLVYFHKWLLFKQNNTGTNPFSG